MTDKPTGPVLISLDETGPSPAEAPPVQDAPTGEAMSTVAAIASRRPSKLARWFWTSLGALIAFVLSIAAYEFVVALVSRNPVVGAVALVLLGLFLAVCMAIFIREWAALARLARLDALQHAAAEADTTESARAVTKQIAALYRGRAEMEWALERFSDRHEDTFDAAAHLTLAERELLAPLDTEAIKEVEAAARQVAMVTALVPLALADVVAALTANLRMIRRIATVYGGRGGTIGSWRLTRAVFSHLVATGAVAVGDDMLGSVAGGGVLSRISRRFGEGLINGALTARVGVAAIEVCRPLPFAAGKRPSVSAIVSRAVTGLFDKKGA